MDVAIVSDTHIPSRAQSIPGWARREMQQADHVIHAGDFDSSKGLADVKQVARRLTAARGNTDPPGLDLPRVATVDLGGVRFVVTHGDGRRGNYEQRVAGIVDSRADERTAVGVSGHTHELLDTTVDGYRLLNPGSVTGAAPAGEATMLTATVEDGDVDVRVRRG